MKKYIIDGLNEYLNRQYKPWHMPGHKRKAIAEGKGLRQDFSNVEKILNHTSCIDVTEVPGLDDLHYPGGMIKNSMEELKSIYGTKSSFYLVNGSTCGIFAAITACVKLMEDKVCPQNKYQDNEIDILVARNCHKSVYNVIELLGLKAAYVEPKKILNGSTETTIYGGVNPKEIEKFLRKYSGIKCIVLTSPTYEGIISDIGGISKITQMYGIPLIVDEAHGAHLPFTKCETEKSAIYCGADIVIQSLHKTLPALSQTAVLHVVGDNKLSIYVKKYLSFYMTSSPSYVFMANMEKAISFACEADWEGYYKRLRIFRNKAKGFKNLKLLNKEEVFDFNGFGYDETRIVLISQKQGISGSYIEEKLAEYSGIICEMSGTEYIVLISTIMDDENDFDYLFDALCLLDKQMDFEGKIHNGDIQIIDYIEKLEGKRASGNIYVYPPGIPIVAKGEIIKMEHIATMKKQVYSGKSLRVEEI